MPEARIQLDRPTGDNAVCGVRALTNTDQVAEKLLANSDRWADDAVDSRDLIDLAMMLEGAHSARCVAEGGGRTYDSIEADLQKAKAHIERPGRLVRCMTNLQMTQPMALLLDRIHKLEPAPGKRRHGGVRGQGGG